ncbi:MAG: hypothetical protein FJX42_11195, partial [Alphaproteobacteria bacterium]|nr:hypothetical protein [Alphaproteobacteria bacterium]
QSLDLQAKETKGPLTFILKASLAGTPIGASGQIGNIEQFLAAGGHYPIRFEVQASGIKADVNGIVDTPRAPKGVDFKIAAKTANLSGANALLKAVTAASEGRSLPAIPLDASLRLRGQGEGYGLDDIKIKAGRSDLSGAVRVGIGGRVTDVTGVLTFSRLDLDEMATTAAPPPPRSSTDGRLFSAAPLPFDLLQKFTVDLTARIDKLVLPGGVAVESVNGRAVAKAGRLSVPLTLQAGGGAVRGELKATDARPGNASFDVSGAGIDWGRMLSAPGLIPPVEGSKAELALNLAGNGRSVRDVMGSLNGEARILLGPGRIHNKTLDLVGADAVGQIVGAINPFAKTDETTTLNCAVVRAVVKDGVAVADNGFALETGKMNVTGTGKIDLRRETIDLAFRPQAKEGVGLGNIVGLVRLEGSLSNPSVGIDPLETMKSALGVGAKIATLGLSETAKSLFSGPAGTVAPCQAALGIQPARQQQQQTPSSSTPPRTQKQPAEKSKSIEDRMRGVGEGISKGLKGLLGQ